MEKITNYDVKDLATRLVDVMDAWEYDFERESAIQDTEKTLINEPLAVVKWLLEKIENYS